MRGKGSSFQYAASPRIHRQRSHDDTAAGAVLPPSPSPLSVEAEEEESTENEEEEEGKAKGSGSRAMATVGRRIRFFSPGVQPVEKGREWSMDTSSTSLSPPASAHSPACVTSSSL